MNCSVKKNMRLAVFLPSLGGGGAERVVVSLLRGFVEKQVAVDLVLAKAEGVYLSQVPSTCRIFNLNSRGVLASLPKLVFYLRRERPFAMLSIMNYANIVAIIACFLSRVKTRLVISERCSFVGANVLPGTKGMLIRFLMKYMYPYADSIISISKSISNDIQSIFKINRENIYTVYNPLCVDVDMDKLLSSRLHKWFDEPVPVVIAAGRMVKQKDFATLLYAIKYIHFCDREIRLIILGEGEDRKSLEGIIKENGLEDCVFLPGFVSNPLAWFAQSSIFVLSSAWEGFGNVIVEAMACGVPIVATDCPHGPSEILEDGRWGRLVQVGDAKGMASAIMSTLDDEEHPDVMARAAFFSFDRAVIDYLRVIDPEQYLIK